MLKGLAKAALRFPRRHRTFFSDPRHVVGTLTRLLICLERERTDLPFAMALLTVCLNDPRDLARIGRDV